MKRTTREGKRTHLIESAAAAFARNGYARTVISDIALEAGVGKGTIYEYFTSKEELFLAVFEWYIRGMTTSATVQVMNLGGSVADRLMAFNEALIEMGKEMDDEFTLFMEFWAASASSPVKERVKQNFQRFYAEFRAVISALIKEGMDRGEFHPDLDAHALAAVYVGSWDGLFLQNWFEKRFALEHTAHHFMSVFLRGLANTVPAATLQGDE